MTTKKFAYLSAALFAVTAASCDRASDRAGRTEAQNRPGRIQTVVAKTPKKVSCPGGKQLRMVARDDRTLEFDCPGGGDPILAEATASKK
jgi:hypothetical protein